VAGTVLKTGTGVRNLRTDQKVIGIVSGSYAEYVIAPADVLTVVPDGLDLQEAAALPLVTTTGAQLMQSIQPKEKRLVLVTGALGSVDRAAVSLPVAVLIFAAGGGVSVCTGRPELSSLCGSATCN
jgi:NADPH:quinone reductase-like Zn-dependent oxidoreductase